VIFRGLSWRHGRIYNELDLVVQSSYTEGMPNVVIEALLMEVPVIATDVGGTREVLKHGLTGVLIPPGEHQSLVASIEEFMANRQKFVSMAREGRQDMLLRFNHARRVERLARGVRNESSVRAGAGTDVALRPAHRIRARVYETGPVRPVHHIAEAYALVPLSVFVAAFAAQTRNQTG
jgi:hypothetical protein